MYNSSDNSDYYAQLVEFYNNLTDQEYDEISALWDSVQEDY